MKQRHVLSLLAVSALLALGGCLNQEKGEIAAVIRTDPSPPEGEYPLVVTFDGRSSVGNIDSYIWDFGDESPLASGEVVHHTYTDPGEYRASLTVREESGREDRAEVVVRVHSKLPVVDELSVDRNVVNANQPVYFYATAHDPDGEVRLFHWDFGDGSPEVTTPSGTVSHVYTVEENYTFPVRYTASVRAEDNYGDLSEPLEIDIDVYPPCHCQG